MKGRISVNSQNLQKHFPQVYQELFSKCPIVISAPASFLWVGAQLVLYGTFAITQKLPLRVYVGLEPTNSKGVKVGKILEFLPDKSRFEEDLPDESIEDKLKTLLKENGNIQNGLTIHILSEVPFSRGLNSSAAIACALEVAFEIYCGKLKKSDIELWQKLTLQKLIEDPSLKFDTVFRKAWKLECVFHGDIAAGATVLGSLTPATYPIVYFPQEFSHLVEIKDELWENHYKFVDSAKYGARRLNELVNLPPSPLWAIDFALIYYQDSSSTASAIMSLSQRKMEFASVEKQTRKMVQDNNEIRNALLPQLGKLHTNNSDFFKIFVQLFKITSDEFLLALKFLLLQGSSPKALSWFFSSLGKINELMKFIVPTPDFANDLAGEFAKFKAVCHMTGNGRGDLLITMPNYSLRDSLDKILKKLSEQYQKNLSIDYATWQDGFETDGVLIEQDLTNQIFSDYVSGGAIQIKAISSDGFIFSQIFTKEKFAHLKVKIDLLLNLQEEKIYIRGEEISSKEIPSSKTTIKALELLIQNIDKEVKNTAFGQTSYFQERNEFQSKIVSPLNKTLQKHLGKKLNITVIGGITDFTVKLSPSMFDIYLFERTF